MINETNTEKWYSLADAVVEIEKATGEAYSVNKLINKAIEQSGYKNDHFSVLARWNNDLSSGYLELREKAQSGDELAQNKLDLIEQPIYYPKNTANDKRARMLSDDYYSTDGENERFVRIHDKRGTNSEIVPARLWNAEDNLFMLIGINLPDTELIDVNELCMKPEVLKNYIRDFLDCMAKKKRTPTTSIDEERLEKLKSWIYEQGSSFDPFNHNFTKQQVWDSCGFNSVGETTRNKFFREYGKKLIGFKSGRPSKNA